MGERCHAANWQVRRFGVSLAIFAFLTLTVYARDLHATINQTTAYREKVHVVKHNRNETLDVVNGALNTTNRHLSKISNITVIRSYPTSKHLPSSDSSNFNKSDIREIIQKGIVQNISMAKVHNISTNNALSSEILNNSRTNLNKTQFSSTGPRTLENRTLFNGSLRNTKGSDFKEFKINATVKRIYSKFEIENLKRHVQKAAIALEKALVHVRGAKSRSSIVEAISSTTNALELLNASSSNKTVRKTYKSHHVCEEMYKGSTYGFPLYREGYVTLTNCITTPLPKIVTLAMIAKNCKVLESIMHGVRAFNMKIRIVIGLVGCGATEKKIMDRYGSHYDTMTVKRYTQGTMAKIWNEVLSFVKTEFVLILRDVVAFDNSDIRIERLVREIDSLGVIAVGGSLKDKQGHWTLGCHQRGYTNFSLVYRQGYDESIHDCVFCDHMDGPFLARTNKVKFDDLLDVGVFTDFFFSSKGEFAVCPDSMFNVDPTPLTVNTTIWSQFMNKWTLYKLQFSSGLTVIVECNTDEGSSCTNQRGLLQHPCCLEELIAINSLVMTVCKVSGLICELHDENLLGAIKFSNAYPWQRESKIRILRSNITAFGKTASLFQQKGYSFNQSFKNDTNTANRSYTFELRSKHWIVEVIPFDNVGDLPLLPQTLLKYNDQYLAGPRNPAFSARNKFKSNIFKHKRFQKSKISNGYTPCLENNGQECFNDGNIFTQIMQP